MRKMLNKKEREKHDIINCCIKRSVTERDAAKRLGLTVRQVQRLKAKMRGGISLLHGNCGRLPSKTVSVEAKEKVLLDIGKAEYAGVNFKHFYELTKPKMSYDFMRKFLNANEFTSPKQRRSNKKKVHKTRERRAKFGELIQADGTPFDWFKSGEMQSLHVLIDDCRGELVGLHISKNECMDGYFEVTRQMLCTHGTPEAFYADGLSIFFSNKKQELTIEEQLLGISIRKTQFGEICDELGIELIHAQSPQAKGRVERVNGTLQSRLPIEFAIRNITTIDEANKFLKEEYIDMFNKQFAVNRDSKSCFVPLPTTVNLDELLTWKTTRKVDKGCSFSLNSVKFSTSTDLASKTIQLLISKRLGIVASHNQKFYDVKPILLNQKNITSSDSVEMIFNRFVDFYTLKNEHLVA